MHFEGPRDTFGPFRGFGADTSFVLFFLGLEAGRTVQNPTLDAALLFVTMLMIIALPYYLLSQDDRPGLMKWLAGRGIIAGFSVVLGAVLNTTYGTVLPESFRFMPLTLLILAAMITCLAQFYGLMRLRPAK